MSLNCKNPEDVLKAIKDNDVRIVDVRFTDLPGIWQHFSLMPRCLDEDAFAEGIGFDGSSIRGFQEIHESDMMVVPDPTSAFLDPFTAVPTLVLICNVRDPITGQPYSRDARYIAQKAETYLKSLGFADTTYFAPEAEFSSSTASATGRAPTTPSMPSIPRRVPGAPATTRIPTWATSPGPRKATSRSRPPTASRTSAPRWCSPWRTSASRSKSTTTRWPPAARPRSTCSTPR